MNTSFAQKLARKCDEITATLCNVKLSYFKFKTKNVFSPQCYRGLCLFYQFRVTLKIQYIGWFKICVILFKRSLGDVRETYFKIIFRKCVEDINSSNSIRNRNSKFIFVNKVYFEILSRAEMVVYWNGIISRNYHICMNIIWIFKKTTSQNWSNRPRIVHQ